MKHLKKPMAKKEAKAPTMIKKEKVGKRESQPEVLALIQCGIPALSRIHLFHLNTTSYAEHIALGELHGCFYEALDCLAEQYIACCGPIPDYEGHEYYDNIKDLLYSLKEKACDVGDCENRGLCATVDEICAILNKACYKLERLK